MSHARPFSLRRSLLALTLVTSAWAVASQDALANAVTVPYSGSFNESSVAAEGGLPAGDYDTIGGLDDVGLFNLVAGNNVFRGGIFTPGDSSDAFLIGIGPNQTLTGASIIFGTNVTDFTPMFAFPPPHWTLEEFTATPTIFDLAMGFNGMSGPQTTLAPSFSRGEGFYSVLIGNGVFGINDGLNSTPIQYAMTFTVSEKTTVLPIPATLPLLAASLGGLGLLRRRKKSGTATP